MSTETKRIVDHIAGVNEYTQRKLSIEGRAHVCTFDEQGRCRFCPKRITDARLMAQGRTGELEAL